MFGAWIAYDEDEIVGLLLTEVVMGNSGYLAIDWVKNGLSKETLLKKAEEWATGLNLAKLIRYTNKNPATFTKKYGWSVWQTVLIKEL